MTVATNANVSGAKMAAQAIAAGADRAFLMGYAYRSAGSAPGSIDPLARSGGSLSLTASLDLYSQYGVPLERVLLGLPLYGRIWPTVSGALGSPRRTDLSGSTFVYQNLDTLRATGTIVAEDYVPVEEASRLVRTVSGVYWQGFYDSQANLEAKMRVEDKSIGQADLDAFAREAHEKICPYSHATRGNVDVAFDVIGG